MVATELEQRYKDFFAVAFRAKATARPEGEIVQFEAQEEDHVGTKICDGK